METHDFDSEELPQHVAHFLRQQARERAEKIIQKADLSTSYYDQILVQENVAKNSFGIE